MKFPQKSKLPIALLILGLLVAFAMSSPDIRLIILSLIAAAVTLAWATVNFAPAPKTHPEDQCPNCGYDLRASSMRCPECGKEILYLALICTDDTHNYWDMVNALTAMVFSDPDRARLCATQAHESGKAAVAHAPHAAAAEVCRKLQSAGFSALLRLPGGQYEAFLPDPVALSRNRCRNCRGDPGEDAYRCEKCGHELLYIVLLCNDSYHSREETVSALLKNLVITHEAAEARAWQAHEKGFSPVAEAPYGDAVIFCRQLCGMGFATILYSPAGRHQQFRPAGFNGDLPTPHSRPDLDPAKMLQISRPEG